MQRRRGPEYRGRKQTKGGTLSSYDTIRLYPPRTSPEAVRNYIISTGQLLNARRVWIVGYGRVAEGYNGSRGGYGYYTIMSAHRGDYYRNDRVLDEMEEGYTIFDEIEHIDINRRV